MPQKINLNLCRHLRGSKVIHGVVIFFFVILQDGGYSRVYQAAFCGCYTTVLLKSVSIFLQLDTNCSLCLRLALSTINPSSCFALSLMHFHQDANKKGIKEAQNPCARWKRSSKISLSLNLLCCTASSAKIALFYKEKERAKWQTDSHCSSQEEKEGQR